ncbi:serine hydrolase [Actinomycetes bacterium KLBMP 9797]
MGWGELDAALDAAPGTVSVYVGTRAYARLADATHYAASTMKVAVLAALYRSGLDLDAEVPVRNEFASAAAGAPAYGCTPEYDSDHGVWDRVGGTASLRWLATRMIVRSSNLATNLVLSHVGFAAVADVWAAAGARHSVTARGIEDYAAREAGIDNLVTAADLAALFTWVAHDAAGPGMLDVLLAQERREDLAAGLPPGTRIAHKNGWIQGVRHGAGIVYPDDAPPYPIAVCTSTTLPDADACALVAKVSAAAWAARHTLS